MTATRQEVNRRLTKTLGLEESHPTNGLGPSTQTVNAKVACNGPWQTRRGVDLAWKGLRLTTYVVASSSPKGAAVRRNIPPTGLTPI